MINSHALAAHLRRLATQLENGADPKRIARALRRRADQIKPKPSK